MRRRPTPTPPPAAADREAAGSSYDWARFGRHRFRTPGAVVVDSPLPPTGQRWMATVWTDVGSPGGWGRMLWQPDPAHGRGWLVPDSLALGDVLEFGAHSPGGSARWYGILDSYDVAAWLTVQGPYTDPTAAVREATSCWPASGISRLSTPNLAERRRDPARGTLNGDLGIRRRPAGPRLQRPSRNHESAGHGKRVRPIDRGQVPRAMVMFMGTGLDLYWDGTSPWMQVAGRPMPADPAARDPLDDDPAWVAAVPLREPGRTPRCR